MAENNSKRKRPKSREVALRCAALVKRYGEVVAVDGIHLEVKIGECFGLLGPNGAGKTTTVEIFEGLTIPDGGVVEVLGHRWGRGDDHALRERLAVQLQETQFAERLTVVETIGLFRSFYKRGWDADEVIQLVELEEKRDARVGKLSGGQKQRLAIACALVTAPDVLFLDEPTTGLDPQAKLKLWDLIGKFQSQGGTILLTTHYMEEAARLCDRVAIMDHGKVIALDTPNALVESLGADEIVEFSLEGFVTDGDLSRLPGVRGVRSRNGSYLLTVSSIGAALTSLLAEVDRHEAKLVGLTTHRATLEDVFVNLTGRKLRDA